jgi:hypothetical protein
MENMRELGEKLIQGKFDDPNSDRTKHWKSMQLFGAKVLSSVARKFATILSNFALYESWKADKFITPILLLVVKPAFAAYLFGGLPCLLILVQTAFIYQYGKHFGLKLFVRRTTKSITYN